MEKNKSNAGKTGAVLGGAAGALGVAMSNPIGRWMIFTAQDEAGLKVLRFVEDVFKNRSLADTAYRVFGVITNTIMAYPAILPIAGGLIAAGIGAIVGKKINKAKLKHKSLTPVENTKSHTK